MHCRADSWLAMAGKGPFSGCACVGCVSLGSLAHPSEPMSRGKMDTRVLSGVPRGSWEDGEEQVTCSEWYLAWQQ